MSLNISTNLSNGKQSVDVSLHDLKSIKWNSRGDTAWVDFTTRDGCMIRMFADHDLAERLADAFDDYENWLSSQEGPTYDDALAAKVSATVRESQAMALK